MLSLISCAHNNTPGRVSKTSDCIVLLHGLARTEKSFLKLEKYLADQGFYVLNIDYPSRKNTIEKLSREIIPKVLMQCRAVNVKKIHFVTHSMGGILIRYYLEHNKIQELGRVVMLSPPNKGSEAVDKLKKLPLFKWINGPAAPQLGTDSNSIPKSLGPPDYEVGIITGDKSVNPILSLMIPGKDDGKVSVESAKLNGMKDFLVVHKSHPFIMNDKKVFEQIKAFIKNGIFDKN